MQGELDAIAVVGLAGRFPGAMTVAQFWRNLCEGTESVSRFAEEELTAAGVPRDLVRHPNYVAAKGFLKEADCFDAAFFGFHPREAEAMDPQHRLFLESCWTALEDAGHPPGRLDMPVGVFAGSSMNTYLYRLLSNPGFVETVGDYQVMISNDKDFLTTRVSYLLNLTGPSMAVQTACSSSLVAIERACQSLVGHECDLALAGGVSVAFPRKTGYFYRQGMILSPDGHCRVFDRDAHGTVPGEGVGVVVLRRLADAMADGDPIYAVIRGWATNNDGSRKVGYTAPGVEGQAAVIATAQALADIDPNTITYVEAHGTGTELGDPIEIHALAQAFRWRGHRSGKCWIGSVKSNIGHLDAAAGVAGLIKTVLALHHKQLPPSLHYREPNPQIDFASSPFEVNTSLREWAAGGGVRRAGVSSFGIGGTNAHLVLEEAPPQSPSGLGKTGTGTATSCTGSPNGSLRVAEPVPFFRRAQLLALSAKSEAAIQAATRNLIQHLNENPGVDLADVAYTLQVGRPAFAHRRTAACQDIQEAMGVLQAQLDQPAGQAAGDGREPALAFMFPGQGAQYVGMGQGIYATEPEFAGHVDYGSEILKLEFGFDLRTLLFADEAQPGSEERLRATAMAQPALFVVEFALAKLLMSWGLQPRAMIGHSLGEYVAACLAGVMSLDDALLLVARRGQLAQETSAGGMLAVTASPEELGGWLPSRVSVAAHNAQRLCVLSGPEDEMAKLESQLASAGQTSQRLRTSHAFHSETVDGILDPFEEFVRQAKLRAPEIPYVTNVTGDWITPSQAADPSHWVNHLRGTVRFSEGIRRLLESPGILLVEVGPGSTLTTLARLNGPNGSVPTVTTMPRRQSGASEDLLLHEALGKLWEAGCQVDWRGYHAGEKRRRVSLPTYPFERRRYCVEPAPQPVPDQPRTVHRTADPSDWTYVPIWKQSPLPPPDSHSTHREPKNWLVFSETGAIGDRLAAELRARGDTVVSVYRGEEFQRLSEAVYRIHPSSFADYVALFREFESLELAPSHLVHLWSLSASPGQGKERGFHRQQEQGFYSLLYLAQLLGRQRAPTAARLDVITNHLHEIGGREPLCPAKATLLGPCAVIPQEYPHVFCRSMDIELPAADRLPSLLEQLLHELDHEGIDPVLAFRGGQRWVQGFERFRLPPATNDAMRLRERGTYLITGGLGQIGMVMAAVLAERAQANLVLTARTPLPPRDAWGRWLREHAPEDETSRRISGVQGLEKLGARVLVLCADAGSRRQMRCTVEEAEEVFGPLHGIIHAAGTVRGSIIHYTIPADCEQQFRGKARGLRVLERILGDRRLDFCMVVSSLSTVLGGIGLNAYAAANAYLDALVQKKNREGGTPWITVNWDGWRFPSAGEEEPGIQEVAELTLTPDEGAEVFARTLARGLPRRIVVSTGDLHERFDRWVRKTPVHKTEEPVRHHPTARHPRPQIRTSYVEARNQLERNIAEVWQDLLGIERIGVHDDFFDLGGHSLLAVQVVARLASVLQTPLSIRTIFEARTVAELATRIEAVRLALQSHEPDVEENADREEIEI